MAEFVCKVADSSGKVFSQVEAAQSVAEAQQKLTDRGLFVYSVRPRGGIVSALSPQRRDRAVGGSDFLIFNQQFNTLIKAGLPILKALDLLAERAASPRLRPVLADVRQLVREGTALSRSEEHTSELQSRQYLVCRLLLEKKKKQQKKKQLRRSSSNRNTQQRYTSYIAQHVC